MIHTWAPGFAEERTWLERGVDHVEIELGEGIQVLGRVVDASTGEGIARARLHGREGPQVLPTVDEEGRFRMHVPNYALDLTASAVGYANGRASWEPRVEDRILETTIRLAPLVAYGGRVLDESGAPLRGAVVRVMGGATTRSGDDGGWALRGPPAGPNTVVGILAMDGERTPALLTLSEGERTDLVLQLGAPAPVTGQVIGLDGLPRPSAVVQVLLSERDGRSDSLDPLGGLLDETRGSLPVRLDSSGRFRIAGLPEGMYEFQTRATLDSRITRHAYERIAAGSPIVGVRLLAPEGIPLVGVVRDDADRPIPGAVIEALVNGHPWTPLGETDSLGKFMTEGLRDVPTWISVEAKGYEHWSRSVVPGEQELEIRLRVAPLVRWTFEFEGDPPPHGDQVRVTARLEDGSSCIDSSFAADAGKFSFSEPTPAGRYVLLARGADRVAGPLKVEVPNGTSDVRVPLPWARGLSITGKVRDQNGEPVKEVELTPRIEGLEGFLATVSPDPSGSFRVEGLPAGRVRLHAHGEGNAFIGIFNLLSGTSFEEHALGVFDVEAGTTGVDLRVVLPPKVSEEHRGGLQIAGRLRLADGTRPWWGWIGAYPEGSETSMVASGAATADGHFLLTDLAAGRYVLRAHARDGRGREGPVAAGARGVEIDLVAFGQIRGRVTAHPDRSDTSVFLLGADGGEPRRTGVQKDGTFAFADVEPGSYRIGAASKHSVAGGLDVTVRTGEIVRGLSIGLVPGAVLKGMVRSKAGVPLPNVDVRADGGQLSSVSTSHSDAGGRFELGPLMAGRWKLAVKGPGLDRELSRDVDLQQGQVVQLDLTPEEE